jgi:hypothetical protein
MQVQRVCHDTLPRLISFSLGAFTMRVDFACAALLALAACAYGQNKHPGVTLSLDERYKSSIEFESIGVSIPLPKNCYFRTDGLMADLAAHQQDLFYELKIPKSKVTYTDSAKNGRSVCFEFAGRKRCDFVWAKDDADPLIAKARLEHEKYHALVCLDPAAVVQLEEGIRSRGFSLSLRSLDEEQAATVVEILSLHLSGVRLEALSGSELVMKALDILKTAKTK